MHLAIVTFSENYTGTGLLVGIICALIASARDRHVIGWFIIGLILNLIGLIILLVLPNIKELKVKNNRRLLDQRKLREQLDKERQVADLRHKNIEQRLGSHDDALGMDTGNPQSLAGNQTPAQIASNDLWFYALEGKRQGPVSMETIRHLLRANAIDNAALVWTEGMEDWALLGDIEIFREDRL
jgi:hypothetical protein